MKRNRAERACQTRERSPAKFSRCGLSPPTAVVGSAHRSDTPVSGTHGPCARPPHRSPGIGSGSACGAPNPTAPSTPPSERPFPTRCERWWPPRSKKGVAPRDPRTAYRPSSECACPLPRAPPLLLPHSACSSPGARHNRRTPRSPTGAQTQNPESATCHSRGVPAYTPSRPDGCGREDVCSPANSPAHRPFPIPPLHRQKICASELDSEYSSTASCSALHWVLRHTTHTGSAQDALPPPFEGKKLLLLPTNSAEEANFWRSPFLALSLPHPLFGTDEVMPLIETRGHSDI